MAHTCVSMAPTWVSMAPSMGSRNDTCILLCTVPWNFKVLAFCPEVSVDQCIKGQSFMDCLIVTIKFKLVFRESCVELSNSSWVACSASNVFKYSNVLKLIYLMEYVNHQFLKP